MAEMDCKSTKPMLDIKGDFIASLENLCHLALMLVATVNTVTKRSDLPTGVAELLVEHSNALCDAVKGCSSDNGETDIRRAMREG